MEMIATRHHQRDLVTLTLINTLLHVLHDLYTADDIVLIRYYSRTTLCNRETLTILI